MSEKNQIAGCPAAPCSASSSETPEMDAFLEGEWDGVPRDLFDLGCKLERERNAAIRKLAERSAYCGYLEETVNRILDLVTTDHESKDEFIHRVRSILLVQNAQTE